MVHQSPAIRRTFSTFRPDAEATEPRAVPGEPAVSRLLERGQRLDAVQARNRRPRATQLVNDSVDRRGSFDTALGVDGPGCTVDLGAAQPISGKDARLLICDDQHTAGPVAPADPARHSGSHRSSPIEDQHDLAIGQTSVQPTKPMRTNT